MNESVEGDALSQFIRRFRGHCPHKLSTNSSSSRRFGIKVKGSWKGPELLGSNQLQRPHHRLQNSGLAILLLDLQSGSNFEL